MEAQCPSGRNRLGMNKPKKQALWSPVMDMKERVTKDEAGEAVRSQIPDPRAFRSVKRFVFYRSM